MPLFLLDELQHSLACPALGLDIQNQPLHAGRDLVRSQTDHSAGSAGKPGSGLGAAYARANEHPHAPSTIPQNRFRSLCVPFSFGA